jgi:hypothetical protein
MEGNAECPPLNAARRRIPIERIRHTRSLATHDGIGDGEGEQASTDPPVAG